MKVLVTGGAGFIGSNLVENLLKDERVSLVRVLDNYSTGSIKNLEPFISNSKLEVLEGDICDLSTCNQACKNMDIVSHQAALGSVPRSIKDPIKTNEVNITGTLNIFQASVNNNISRVVFAASSSTYGDCKELPKVESVIGKPLSPYAITKYVNELYAEVFAKTYNFNFIGLRYFNVFGPKQSSNGAYAAVIPIFFNAALNNIEPIINGDGSISRDFTYVSNAVHANIQAIFSEKKSAINQIYNIACGHSTSLASLWNQIKKISGTKVKAVYGPDRVGDIKHSLADITKVENLLDYRVQDNITTGLLKAYHWYKESSVVNNIY